MALPFLAAFAPRIRALYPIIQGGVSRGLSSRAINASIKDATGKGVNRQKLLDVIRAITGVKQAQSQLKFLTKTSIPNINRLPQALTTIRRKLSFKILVKAINLASGETVEQNVTLTMDKPRSRDRMETMAVEIIESRQERYGLEVLTATLTEGLRRP